MPPIDFSDSDFIGAYGVCFDGFLVPVEPPGSPVPMVAVGRMLSGGNGQFLVWRTVQIPGLNPQEQTADGYYNVDSDGRGTAQLTVKLNDQPVHIERYSFVIDGENKEIQFISTAITYLYGQPFKFPLGGPIHQLVIRGVGKKQ